MNAVDAGERELNEHRDTVFYVHWPGGNASSGMGPIHKVAGALGDSPTTRALQGNFSSHCSLPQLAKHFFLRFLFLLWAKKPHTNENRSGSTPLLVTMLTLAFTGLSDRIKV